MCLVAASVLLFLLNEIKAYVLISECVVVTY